MEFVSGQKHKLY